MDASLIDVALIDTIHYQAYSRASAGFMLDSIVIMAFSSNGSWCVWSFQASIQTKENRPMHVMGQDRNYPVKLHTTYQHTKHDTAQNSRDSCHTYS